MSEPERLDLGRHRGDPTNDAKARMAIPPSSSDAVAGARPRSAASPRCRASGAIARRVGILSTWFLGLIAVLMVTAIVLFYTLSDVPRPEDVALPQVATILYADGSVMGHIGTIDHTDVPIAQVPKPVRWDVLAAEDRNFYNEPGISITGTLRAALQRPHRR